MKKLLCRIFYQQKTTVALKSIWKVKTEYIQKQKQQQQQKKSIWLMAYMVGKVEEKYRGSFSLEIVTYEILIINWNQQKKNGNK